MSVVSRFSPLIRLELFLGHKRHGTARCVLAIISNFPLSIFCRKAEVTSKDKATSKNEPVKVDNKLKSKNTDVTQRKPKSVTPLTHLTEATMEQGDFMRTVEEDANRRAQDRRERNERSDDLKQKGNAAFKEGQLEKALLYYNQVSCSADC